MPIYCNYAFSFADYNFNSFVLIFLRIYYSFIRVDREKSAFVEAIRAIKLGFVTEAEIMPQ